jgi:t-SNARE complex subunit (syntaxin)
MLDKNSNIDCRITQREEGITDIHRSLIYLHQNFSDVLLLVANQGDVINSIDDSIIKSLDYTTRGVTELQSAVIYSKKSNSLKRVIILIILIIGVIAILISYFAK